MVGFLTENNMQLYPRFLPDHEEQ
uniref:Uncharacterized protein n=1 Tax=Arundo donax TaxID=35708 RepID=A0A0A9G6L7_ARUDO